jgi:hypothetical protein
MKADKKIKESVVSGYKKIENKFTETFLTPDDDFDQDEVGKNDPNH